MKIKRALIQFCLLGALLWPAAVQAQFTYVTNVYNEIVITGYTGPGGAVTIPSTISGMPVTIIEPFAFSGIFSLTSITIPDSVAWIEEGAFSSCQSLANVVIGKGATNIEGLVFGNCSSLMTISVDSSNLTYSSVNGVLYDKNRTTLVEYPGGIAGPYSIPIGVTSIGFGAFYDCYRLTGVTIPNSVTNIGNYAFYTCGLTVVTIPASVISLGYVAFADCPALRRIYFQGNAPVLDPSGVFPNDPATVYYLAGTTGWGATYDGLVTSMYLPVVTGMDAGLYHSLFLKSDGSLWGMGENGAGQLGIGNFNGTNIPVRIAASNVVAVAGGGFHTLFVKKDGSLWAMGDNQYGELGDGTLNNTNLPEMIVASNVTAVAAGVYHSLFLKSDGTLWGMGYNHDGQLGDGSFGPSNQTNRPEYIATNVIAIAAGNYHSLFQKSDGSLWGMGYNGQGALGTGNNNSVYSPVEITNRVFGFDAGGNHTLYLNGGSLWGAGDNSQGEFGDGTYSSTSRPERTIPGVTTIAAGSNHTLFNTNDGSLWGTGGNGAGQLGDGTFTTINRAEQIVPAGVIAVTAGDQHSLFLEGDGSLWGMGNNGGGELGDGTFNNTNRPEQIVGPIVANGGFEMGNFDGWAITSFGYDTTIVVSPHSGLYAAQFTHNINGLAGVTMSQTLSTQSNQVYLLSLWVNGTLNSGSGVVDWNSQELVNEPFSNGWTHLQFIVTATSASTVLKFATAANDNIAHTTIVDDVNVVPLVNYNHITARLANGGGVQLSFQGNLNANYALDRTFNLVPPIDWIPQSTNVTDSNGVLLLTNTPDPTTNNFWRIRSVP